MLATVSGVTFLATLFMAFRNFRQWDAYHKGHVTRVSMVNGIFVTAMLAGGTVVLWLLRAVF